MPESEREPGERTPESASDPVSLRPDPQEKQVSPAVQPVQRLGQSRVTGLKQSVGKLG